MQSKNCCLIGTIVVVPDVNGCVVKNFPVAVPAAVDRGTATSWMVSADLAKNLVFAILPQVQLQV